MFERLSGANILLVALLSFAALFCAMSTTAQETKNATTLGTRGENRRESKALNRSEYETEKAQGKLLFVKSTCWGCHPHGENSLNGDKPLKGPAFQKKYKSDQSIIDFVRKGSPDCGMPPFPREKLSDADLKTIIVFIRSLSPVDAK